MRRLAILGASGHGKVVADAAVRDNRTTVEFYDDVRSSGAVGPWTIAGTSAELARAGTRYDGVVVAIGDNRIRLAKQRELAAAGVAIATVIHPAAVVSPFATIGAGTVLFAGAIVNPFAVLGEACIVNTSASVDHDCLLGDGVHLSPGAHLGGGVRVGDATWIGLGAVVRHGISVGARVMVGAGAAVVDDVHDDCTVLGVPARPRDKLR